MNGEIIIIVKKKLQVIEGNIFMLNNAELYDDSLYLLANYIFFNIIWTKKFSMNR